MSYPELVEKVIEVAATATLTAQDIAFSEVQRQAILADPRWQNGDYRSGNSPEAGLAIARMLSMITYVIAFQSEESMELCSPLAMAGRWGLSPQRLRRPRQRFDANSYLYISRAMDLYDVSEGYSSLDAALRHIRSKALFIGIRSDSLFPAARVRWLAEQVSAVGGDET